MRMIFVCLLCAGSIAAMEPERFNSRSLSTDIAEQIAHVIIDIDNTNDLMVDDKFKTLVLHYFKKESLTIETSIMPHLRKKLRDSDSEINKILEEDDKAQLQNFIDKLISESIEDAFSEKQHKYDELKQLAGQQEKKAKYALITAVVSGVSGILAVFFGVFFGKS